MQLTQQKLCKIIVCPLANNNNECPKSLTVVKKVLTTCGDNQQVESWKQKEQPSFYSHRVKAIQTFSFNFFFGQRK